MRALASLALSACLLFGCTPKAGTRAPSAASASDAFSRLTDAHFQAAFAFKPTSGTRVGLHAYDDRLEDRSRARIDARIVELRGELDALGKIDRGALGFDEAIDAEALEHSIRAELFDLETLRSWEIDPMRYAGLPGRSIDALMKRDFAPGPDRVRSATLRLRAVPALYAAAKANLTTPARELTELALRMAKGSAKFLEKDVVEWAKLANGGTLPADFVDADAKAVAAAKDFSTWLEVDLLPRSTAPFALGEARFREKLRLEEMVDVPLDALLARGEAQLQKDYEAFVATAKKIDAAKSPLEVMRALSDEHPSEDELIAKVAASVEEARKFVVDKGLVTVPSEVRPLVAETPPFARAATFASMDVPGPFENKATEAFYYVTPVEKDWEPAHKEQHLRMFNKWVTAIINVHEAWPGHYLQFLWAKRFPTKVRKLVSAGSNSEGWAHYTEQMVVDEGFGGGDPKMRLAQLQEALVRDCRYVAGIRLHVHGWTVADAAKLFEEKSFSEPANALEEARRGTYNPTYLYYTLGKLEILALAAEYRAKKNASLREFHDAFVAQGALPIPLVRKLLLR